MAEGWYTAAMFHVTDAALDALYKGRVDAGHAEGEVMRLISQGMGPGSSGLAGLTTCVPPQWAGGARCPPA